MINNQLGRRNLTEWSISNLRGARMELEKQKGFHHNDGNGQTAVRLAVQHNVSQATIERDASFSRDLKAIEEETGITPTQASACRRPPVRVNRWRGALRITPLLCGHQREQGGRRWTDVGG